MLVPTLRLLSHLGVVYIKALVTLWHKLSYTFVDEVRRQPHWRNFGNNTGGREQNRPWVLGCNYSAFRKTQVFQFLLSLYESNSSLESIPIFHLPLSNSVAKKKKKKLFFGRKNIAVASPPVHSQATPMVNWLTY